MILFMVQIESSIAGMERFDIAWLTLLILETEYSALFGQYCVYWCPGSLSRQGISKHGFDSIE